MMLIVIIMLNEMLSIRRPLTGRRQSKISFCTSAHGVALPRGTIAYTGAPSPLCPREWFFCCVLMAQYGFSFLLLWPSRHKNIISGAWTNERFSVWRIGVGGIFQVCVAELLKNMTAHTCSYGFTVLCNAGIKAINRRGFLRWCLNMTHSLGWK